MNLVRTLIWSATRVAPPRTASGVSWVVVGRGRRAVLVRFLLCPKAAVGNSIMQTMATMIVRFKASSPVPQNYQGVCASNYPAKVIQVKQRRVCDSVRPKLADAATMAAKGDETAKAIGAATGSS